jgi:putative GTP pyrophosphokinase
MPSLDFDLEEAQFRTFYAEQSAALETACASFTGMVAAVVTQSGRAEIAKVEGRVKDVDECIRKFVRKYRPALEEGNTTSPTWLACGWSASTRTSWRKSRRSCANTLR